MIISVLIGITRGKESSLWGSRWKKARRREYKLYGALVCGRFGCGHFGLWPFWFVAVLTRNRTNNLKIVLITKTEMHLQSTPLNWVTSVQCILIRLSGANSNYSI